jgi:hypothetical protein
MSDLNNTRYPHIELVAYPNPGAGINLALPALANSRSELLALSFNFVTSAAAVQREVHAYIYDGTNAVQISPHMSTQGASSTNTYYIHGLPPVAITGGLLRYWLPWPPDLLLWPGCTIVVDARLIDVGDQFVNARALWKRWPWA